LTYNKQQIRTARLKNKNMTSRRRAVIHGTVDISWKGRHFGYDVFTSVKQKTDKETHTKLLSKLFKRKGKACLKIQHYSHRI
jgi:hypothetical protein